MNDHWIAPPILSPEFACLGEAVDTVLEAGAVLIHFDVMDNHYVPNLTIGPPVCKTFRDHGVTADIRVAGYFHKCSLIRQLNSIAQQLSFGAERRATTLWSARRAISRWLSIRPKWAGAILLFLSHLGRH